MCCILNTTQSASEKSFLQSVTYILQKAFLRHTVERINIHIVVHIIIRFQKMDVTDKEVHYETKRQAKTTG